jgi:hypothetical protein
MTDGRLTSRVVVIPAVVFRDVMLAPEAILRAHGIVPTRPYDHEHIVVHGAPAHRYTQPPRPRPPQHPEALMTLWIYHHSGYGYIIRAATREDAADYLMFLVGDNPVHPHSREQLLRGLHPLDLAGEPGVIAEWPG